MQRLCMTRRFWQNVQTASPTTQRRVIGNSDIQSEHIGDRSQQAFSLAQRLVEHQAKCETGLDGYRRIDWLATALASSWRAPRCHSFFCEPKSQASPPHQSSIVLGPIRHPISHLGKLVATTFVELVRHGLPERRGRNDWVTLPAGHRHRHPSRNSPVVGDAPSTAWVSLHQRASQALRKLHQMALGQPAHDDFDVDDEFYDEFNAAVEALMAVEG
jgi:hypothetical protein